MDNHPSTQELPRRLHVAHVLQSFEVGGGERLAVELSGSQARSGHDVWAVQIAPGREGPLGRTFRARGVATLAMPKRRGVDATLPMRLAGWFARRRIDVVHAHNPQALVYAAPAAKMTGARVIYTMHGQAPDLGRRMWLRRAAARLVDAFVAVSPELAAAAVGSDGAPAERMLVIENGVDPDRFAPDDVDRRRARTELGFTDEDWVIGTAARLSPEKDQATLIRAAAPLLDGRTWLAIAGDGPERPRLEALAAELGVAPRVRFLGAVLDVAPFLRALDTFALSSTLEALPLSVLEAMSTSVPIAATSVGGVPHVLAPGETGLLVPPGDPRALGASLAALRDDPARARAIGRRAREAVLSRYSAERMAQAYAALYTRLVQP
jgi:glycosyltransferase involved in cell wall biosynthesis